jgi:hypothetical protein
MNTKKLRTILIYSLINTITITSFSQTIEFFSSSGSKIGKISYDDTPNMECGNCGALFDSHGNKVCEVSPLGGYREFKGRTGVFCTWTMDYKVYDGSELKGYGKEEWNGKYTFLKLFNRQGKQIGYTKYEPDLLTIIYYSMSGKKLMTANKSLGYGKFNGHDTDLTLAYYFMYVVAQ